MLGSPLKKQPTFGYHQAMHRAVLTLLVGLMLSLVGGASAIGMPDDDETVCSRATSGAPPVWSTNLLYVEEAVKRGLTCGVGNTTATSVNGSSFNQKHTLMVNEIIDAHKDILQSSEIVKVQISGKFEDRGKKSNITFQGFATANDILLFNSWHRGFSVINGSLRSKSKIQILK